MANDTTREILTNRANMKLDYLEKALANKKFVIFDHFTLVDSYLYVVLNWTGYVGLKRENYPHVQKYVEGIAALPGVQEAHKLMATNPEHL